MSPFVMPRPLLHPKTLGNGCTQFKFPSLLSHFLSIYHGFRFRFKMQDSHQKILTTRLHASHRQHCNVNFVFVHNVICYIDSLLSCIHVQNITCNLVVAGVILRKLECRWEMERVIRVGQSLKCNLSAWETWHGFPSRMLSRTAPYFDLHCAITIIIDLVHYSTNKTKQKLKKSYKKN